VNVVSGRVSRVSLFLLAAACATNPATGRRELSLISESQEISLGRQGAEETLRALPLVADSNVQRYVRGVAQRLVAVAERQHLPWAFHVLDDGAVNAFAYPGGFIFITRGILTHMTSEAELAGVLGHEIGHVTARHSAQMITRAQLAQAGLIVGSVVSPVVQELAGAASVGLGLLFLKYGRDAEYQADELGFRYMVRDGYDPRGISNMFTMLGRTSALVGGGRLPEWQSTHPYPEHRVEQNERRIAAMTQPIENPRVRQDEFLRVLDGMVFGEDPRHGYFEDRVFYHPDMRFRFTFPEGWQTQNQPTAVIGQSPSRDAIVRLALAEGPAARALGTFLGQQGITAGRTSRNPINGLPAATAEFRAQTQQGVVSGLVAYVEHGGRTFELLAYTPENRYQAYVNAFLASVQSFNRLTDQAKIDKPAQRIRIVRIDRDMTIDAFHRANPSAIPLEYVAAINGVEPGALLRAGRLVKQVR
jgi:predicted Zn-dependent protease